MFFTYPTAATNDNWVNSTLIEILQRALTAQQIGDEPPEFYGAVPELYRAQFSRGKKFSELYNAFLAQCQPLDMEQRNQILEALIGQNQFPEIFAINASSHSIVDTFPNVHNSARKLFDYAFGKLSDLKTPDTDETVRSRYHKLVHAHINSGCCPFCGLEYIDAPDPDLVDPDLDHYLAASKYPFAGANLRNLTAMGTTCNRSYKGAQDILLNELNQKTVCMDPYGNENVTLSLTGTVLLPGEGSGPEWSLAFAPDEKSLNWRRLFKLEARLRANVLEKQYKTWLKNCVAYAEQKNIDITSLAGARDAIREFKSTCAYESLHTVAVLKTSFFEQVQLDLNDPEKSDRMHNFIVNIQAT